MATRASALALSLAVSVLLPIASAAQGAPSEYQATPQKKLDVILSAISFRASQLDDNARLSECGLEEKTGIPIDSIRRYLNYKKTQTRLLRCTESNSTARNLLVIYTLLIEPNKTLVSLTRSHPVDAGRRVEDISWGPGWNRPLYRGSMLIELWSDVVSP